MKLCDALRHVPFESPDLLEPHAIERGLEVRSLDVPGLVLPRAALEAAKLLAVRGGPIDDHEASLYLALVGELAILETPSKSTPGAIGICHGAQPMVRSVWREGIPASPGGRWLVRSRHAIAGGHTEATSASLTLSGGTQCHESTHGR